MELSQEAFCALNSLSFTLNPTYYRKTGFLPNGLLHVGAKLVALIYVWTSIFNVITSSCAYFEGQQEVCIFLLLRCGMPKKNVPAKHRCGLATSVALEDSLSRPGDFNLRVE